MNVNHPLIKIIRFLLYPISFIYGLILLGRYYLYKKNLLKSATFSIPTITVGNFSAGGTGKTPLIIYLLTLLHKQHKCATLSRGYLRKTKGYVLANAQTLWYTIGDEPMLFHKKFYNISVAVCEDRLLGFTQLLQEKPDTEIVLFDDALQHRSIEAGLNICLTTYNEPYYKDYYLPTGYLRDHIINKERAQILVVTKCPQILTVSEAQQMLQALQPAVNCKVFFSTIVYGNLYNIFNTHMVFNKEVPFLLVTGIANNKNLITYLQEKGYTFTQLTFNDHKNYTEPDIQLIKQQAINNIVVTTEKDAVKLFSYENILGDVQVYAVPIQISFLFNKQQEFDETIKNFINNN
jgi:tetraacyldisaccharide 4'-kinase